MPRPKGNQLVRRIVSVRLEEEAYALLLAYKEKRELTVSKAVNEIVLQALRQPINVNVNKTEKPNDKDNLRKRRQNIFDEKCLFSAGEIQDSIEKWENMSNDDRRRMAIRMNLGKSFLGNLIKTGKIKI